MAGGKFNPRGAKAFKLNSSKYEADWKGNIADFGVETIRGGNELLYRDAFAGGLVDRRRG